MHVEPHQGMIGASNSHIGATRQQPQSCMALRTSGFNEYAVLARFPSKRAVFSADRKGEKIKKIIKIKMLQTEKGGLFKKSLTRNESKGKCLNQMEDKSIFELCGQPVQVASPTWKKKKTKIHFPNLRCVRHHHPALGPFVQQCTSVDWHSSASLSQVKTSVGFVRTNLRFTASH